MQCRSIPETRTAEFADVAGLGVRFGRLPMDVRFTCVRHANLLSEEISIQPPKAADCWLLNGHCEGTERSDLAHEKEKKGRRSAGTLSITGRHPATWESPGCLGYAVLDRQTLDAASGPGSSAFPALRGREHRAASQRLAVSTVACFDTWRALRRRPLTQSDAEGRYELGQIITKRCSTRRPVGRDPPTFLPGALRQSPPR